MSTRAAVGVRHRVRRTPVTWVRGGGLTTLLFLLPMLLIFGAFSWYPIVRTVIMSLQHTNLVDHPTWVGLDNFRAVLNDPLLPTAVKNTAYFAFLALIFGYPIPLAAAVLMSEVRRFRGVYSALAYLPVVIPPVVAVLLWKTFYDPSPTGVFNTILGWVGLGPYPWLQSASTAMPSLVLESTWANAGATVIIYLAALTGVNRELYEAASVDGASLWRKVWHITIPQLRGVLLVTMILQIIGTAQVFLEPYLFTSGGPTNSTLTVLLMIYNYAFGNSLGGDYGNATALSLMLAVFLALFSLVYLRVTRSWSTRVIALGTRRRARASDDTGSSALLSSADWRKRSVKWGVGTAHVVLLIVLVIVGLGPIVWLAKSAITPTADTIATPMAWFPHGAAWSNLHRAWFDVQVGRYFWNTVVLAIGSWLSQIVIATTAGFALSVLRPRYGKILMGLVLATLFVPAVVLLVPLYVEIVHPPLINHSFIDSYWAIWLPAGASAFNVVLMKRFFDNLPREIFEAARIDGAGPFRLFWSVVLPMSKPILGVVSVFAILASWKDFLWPLLVLTNPNEQPLSVRLPTIQSQTELGVFLAALFIASLVPIIGFLIFQRSFMRGSGLGGAIKG